MPDLFPHPAREPAQQQGQPGPSVEPATLSSAELSPYRAVFAETFGHAYDTAAEPTRGARVMADVEAEARTFGDEWTVQSLAAERFGAAAQPQFNDWLAASLRTDAGEQAVLHVLKDGAPTPDRGLGNDLVVLLDNEAAGGMGHIAVLIGDDSTGWRLYSKDGSAGINPAWGAPTRTNQSGPDRASGPLYAEFRTLDAFFSTTGVADRFEGSFASRWAAITHRAETARARRPRESCGRITR